MQGDEALLVPLAHTAQHPARQVHVARAEGDGFRRTQACGVEHFQQRAIAQFEGRIRGRSGAQKPLDLFFSESVR